MSEAADLSSPGRFDARYLAFLETVTQQRPSLHRYCARMTGSLTDGEDVAQEVLLEAYLKLEQYDESRALKPWLFRIAHNRCIDFLRKRGVRLEAETAAGPADRVETEHAAALGLGSALEYLVVTLPAKERACVLLKDVLDHSLEEIAELTDSTVGGVKAALHRGRGKIKASPAPVSFPAPENSELVHLLSLYVDRFNRRDWPAVRELISADARLRVAGRYAGALAESPYFTRYEQWPLAWQLAVGMVDGEPLVIVFEGDPNTWTRRWIVRLDATGNQIQRVSDYALCPWILDSAAAVNLVA